MVYVVFYRVLVLVYIFFFIIYLEYMIKLWGSNFVIELVCYDVLVVELVLGFRRLEVKKKSVVIY